jgi:hypothetical protein
VRELTTYLKTRARIVALKRLALDRASTYEHADAALSRELRALIDGDKAMIPLAAQANRSPFDLNQNGSANAFVNKSAFPPSKAIRGV